MLPSIANIENTDDLLFGFETEEQENTKTFGINKDTKQSNKSTAAILGSCVLGKMELGKSVESNERNIDILYCMGGKIDDLAAVKQNIFLLLSIEADQHIIYPYTYGIQTLDLIGKPIHYVMALVPERIKETLLTDDRITDVTDFEFEVNANKLNVKFVVHTIYGEMEEETVVIY